MSGPKFFLWKESFTLGIPMVDAQHQMYFDMLNQLYEGVVKGAEASALARAHADIRSYAAKHFADEEHFLSAVGYPHLAEHACQHRKFLERVEAAQSARPDAPATLAFMKEWMLQHILGTDRRYEEWMTARRQQRASGTQR